MSVFEDFRENTVFPSIRTEYGNLPSKSPYSVWMRENLDQGISKYGLFSRSVFR